MCDTKYRNRKKTRMWANAQCDGRPAEHRWRPLFNAAKFGWRPLLDAVQQRCQDAKPVEICRGAPNYRIDLSRQWAEVQHIVGTCGGYIYCCLTSFFPIVDTCLNCKDIADQVVRWCPDGDFWWLFCVLCFQWAACSRFQTCILNSHSGHTMCGRMAHIQSAATEIRRRKKRRRYIEITAWKYNGLPYSIGRR